MTVTVLRPLVICIALLSSAPVFAQGTNVAFGTIKQDTTAPIEVTADTLTVDQATGTALFKGNVLINQDELRLSAQKVKVIYRSESAGIAKLAATGNVTLISGTDAAETQRADYDIDSGTIVMTGDVLFTQGPNVLTAQKMTIDLTAGTIHMSGQVKIIFQTAGN